MAFLESLSVHSHGIEKYGFVNETECCSQNNLAASASLCNPSSDSSTKTDAGGDDLASEKAGRKTCCGEVSSFIDDQIIENTDFILSRSLSVDYLGLQQYGFISSPDSLLSLALEKYGFFDKVECFEVDTTKKEEKEKVDLASHNHGVGRSNIWSEIEKHGFVDETECCFQNNPAASDSLCSSSSDSSAKTASRLLKTDAGGDDLASGKAERKTCCDEVSTFIDDQIIEINDFTLSRSLSVDYLGLQQYGFISSPDSLLSLALEKYGYFDEVESFEIETTKQEEEEEKGNLASQKLGVGLSNFWSEKSIQAPCEDEDADECYKRFSESLRVYIPAPHKYNGCDIEAINFLSSYYPTKSQQA